MHYDDIIAQYNNQVSELTAKYETLRFEDVHSYLIPHLPEAPAAVLDIGAGSGRDAAWFAAKGFDVVAVEPADSMLFEASALHDNARIHWLKDSLPDLRKTIRLGMTFDVILLSAVWMHIAPDDRSRVFRKLVTMLRPGGTIAISLRHGPHRNIDSVFPVSVMELEQLAIQRGLNISLVSKSADHLGRAEVHWENVLLQLPEDGTGALPLLRHIIINDAKSSTYKLALLRTLVRVADSASGLAVINDDEYATVPLGLVALFWIRIYKPLIEHDIPQMPLNRDGHGLSFVGPDFKALANTSPFELRVGATLYGDSARNLTNAIKRAAQTIRKMPAHYITYPNSSEQIFKITGKAKPISAVSELNITGEYLSSFGEMKVPLTLWRAFTRYAAWIEPALLFEWTELMRQYSDSHGIKTNTSDLMTHLKWMDPNRDTALVRGLVLQMMANDRAPVHCIWTGKALAKERFDIDHCFPFAAWPCNDLWNLLPANPRVNLDKSNKLVDVPTLNDARDRIEAYWNAAYFAEPISYEDRFRREAIASLPMLEVKDNERFFDSMFDAVFLKRTRLKHDHNLTEWRPQFS